MAGYSQTPTPPKNIAAFFQEIIGEWIGTVEQYTGGEKADTKYFHGIIKKANSDTYETVFEYYRFDKESQKPVEVGVTTITTKITTDETAICTITGKGTVFINPKTQKPAKHTLTEVLRMTPSGSLVGKGSGKISISGITLGAGKNGKVSDYTSTWVLKDGVLSISEQLKVTFKILFIKKHYDIVDNFVAKRGSDVMSLIKNDANNTKSVSKSPSR